MKIISPYATEKTFALIDRENSLQFLVARDANKTELVEEVEKLLEVKVEKITVKIGKKGKIATVKLAPEYSASDIATRIGVM
ncbi:MAG: 50S ribosomal protein L23 [Candidatus Thermoplasmatota archaeon]|nr:50S ribosomal protein L23 [Candidatus Thermoplasmatota archaeon]